MQYPATFTLDDDGSLLVQFPDIPEAITSGADEAEAMAMALDCLLTAFDFYFDDRRAIPAPSAVQPGQVAVMLDEMATIKVLLHNEMVAKGVRKADLARLLGIPAQHVGRLLNPKQTTRLELISQAFCALGRRLEIQVV